jgi:hypothetical protein
LAGVLIVLSEQLSDVSLLSRSNANDSVAYALSIDVDTGSGDCVPDLSISADLIVYKPTERRLRNDRKRDGDVKPSTHPRRLVWGVQLLPEDQLDNNKDTKIAERRFALWQIGRQEWI